MVDVRSANRFASSFIQGFSFVDQINQRNRAQAKLDERLKAEQADREFRKRRLDELDQQRRDDRATTASERERIAIQREREADARRLFAANAPLDELQEFADLPGFAEAIRAKRLEDISDAERQADFETLFGGQNVGAIDPQATEQPSAEGLSGQVQGAVIPPDEFAPEFQERLTDRDLNNLADEDPQAAMQVRDQAEADRQPIVAEGLLGTTRTLPITAGEVRKRKEGQQKASAREQINAEWRVILDVTNKAGDEARNLPPTTLTAKYFEDRSNLDPKTRIAADKRMGPIIGKTIAVQREALQNATTPGEVANATRNLSKSYGLANTMGLEYNPLDAAGVDDRGFPIGANQALTDSVMEQTREGPGMAMPSDPRTAAADNAMIKRGVTGNRMSARFSQAAYRRYKDGEINFEQYLSLYTTGKLPVAGPELKSFAPEDEVWASYPDGSQQIIRFPYDPKNRGAAGRNLFGDEGLAQINRIGEAYNTSDFETRGTDMINSFIGAMEQNEQLAKSFGYDFANVLDTVALFNRWTEIHILRDAFNDEAFFNGDMNPDFTEHFGTLQQALFDRTVDEAVASGEFEKEGSTLFGFGGDPVEVTPLKPRNPAIYTKIRKQYPEFKDFSDAQLEREVLRPQGL